MATQAIFAARWRCDNFKKIASPSQAKNRSCSRGFSREVLKIRDNFSKVDLQTFVCATTCIEVFILVVTRASSETQGQLVGTTGFSWTKVYNKSGRAPGHLDESLQQERESPWALTLTERVPEAFEIPPSDWPEKYFSGQSAKRNSRATLMSSYTRLFSSSNAVVAWPVQREHF